MRTFLIIALVVMAHCSVAPTAQAQPPTLHGDWVGGFMFKDNWVTLNAHFVSAQGGIDGTADIAFTGYKSQRGVALSAIALKDARLHFETSTNWGNIIIDGNLKGHTISGTYRYAGKSGVFGLTRIVDVSPGVRAKLFGAYQASPNKVISISDFGGLRFVDYDSGQYNTLYPLSDDTFFSGPGQAVWMKRYAPGFWSTMTDWLMDRLTASAR